MICNKKLMKSKYKKKKKKKNKTNQTNKPPLKKKN